MEQEYEALYLCLRVSNFQSTQDKDHASHRVRLWRWPKNRWFFLDSVNSLTSPRVLVTTEELLVEKEEGGPTLRLKTRKGTRTQRESKCFQALRGQWVQGPREVLLKGLGYLGEELFRKRGCDWSFKK